jgi:hypothetical protein
MRNENGRSEVKEPLIAIHLPAGILKEEGILTPPEEEIARV